MYFLPIKKCLQNSYDGMAFLQTSNPRGSHTLATLSLTIKWPFSTVFLCKQKSYTIHWCSIKSNLEIPASLRL